MSYLLDTNVLVRLANSADAKHATATHAVAELHRRGEALHLTPQVLIEFRSVATRPSSVNGLGLTAADAELLAAGFEQTFPLLPELSAIFSVWKSIVQATGVIGKQVHDARLVAVCHVHQISHLLTFNTKHFATLGLPGPRLTIVDPTTL